MFEMAHNPIRTSGDVSRYAVAQTDRPHVSKHPVMLVVLCSCLSSAACVAAAVADVPGEARKAAQSDRAQPAETKPQTGRFRASWPLPDRETFAVSYEALARRYGVKPPAKDLRERSRPDPTYELYVPPDYAPGRPFGLFVWISAGAEGGIPAEWSSVLGEHHLIWIGPNAVGNDVDVLRRTYMAIEAVRQAKLHYTIDDERVYVAGISGGGRVASHAALVAADTFTGGFYVVGCNFWKAVPAGDGKKIYPGFWRKPDVKLLKKARTTGRYVLLTGSEDFNRVNTECIYQGYVKDKFAHATYLEVPGMGHAMPDAMWFAKGLKALDETLAPPAELYEQAVALEKKNKLGDACLAYGRAAVRGAGEPFAAEAARKATALRKAFDQQVVRVRGWIKEGNWARAAAENAILKGQYGPLAVEQFNRFADEIKKGKTRRR